ncbi:MAG: hypothetical protein ACP5G0_02810 [Desulfomonilia bacterium]
MTKFLKPLTIADHEQVVKICAQYFTSELGFRILEFNLGNTYTGSIDLLAVNHTRVHLIFINTSHFPDTLFRSLTGYRRFRQDSDFLCRVYGAKDVNFDLTPELVILSPDFLPEISSVLREMMRVPVKLFRYLMFGHESDPELFVEELVESKRESAQEGLDLAAVRKNLGIEESVLTDDEIREFLAQMRS